MWKIAEDIGDKEGRMDVVFAAAGVVSDAFDCLECPAELFRKVRRKLLYRTGILS